MGRVRMQSVASRWDQAEGRMKWSMKRSGLKVKVMGVDVGSTAVRVANSVEAG